MLEVSGLRVAYLHDNERFVAVRDVDLRVPTGTAVALVGESGSGKSTLALAILRLIGPPTGKVEAGQVSLDGVDLLSLEGEELRRVRHRYIGYIPQDPTTSLDPLCTIYRHIDETLSPSVPQTRRWAAVAELLGSLGITNPEARMRGFPHELSGGMKQRVAIATALARDPRLIIADEPTTALDVTTQLGILKLIDRQRREREVSLLFVTHDLSVAAVLCQQVVVLYAGQVAEAGPTAEVIGNPRHPYTRALVDAIPSMARPRARLRAIPGSPPSPAAVRVGCPFAPRCPIADSRCHAQNPPLINFNGVQAACWKVAQ